MSVLALRVSRETESPVAAATGLSRWLDDWSRPVVARRPVAPAASVACRPIQAAVDAVGGADGEDLRASLGGDGEAYARIMRRYQDLISAYMWRFTRDRTQWEELVGDVFVEAYLSLRSFQGRSPLAHWLKKIATRVGYRWWKQRARQRMIARLPIREWDRAVEARDDAYPAEEAAALVHAALATLPARDRLVLTLLYLEECSVAEAAGLTGWSQTMVKVQAYRARGKLKRSLGQARVPR